MDNTHSPLVPAGYDIAWSIVAVLAFALMIVAIVSMTRSANRLTATQALAWTLVVLVVPVIGPAIWISIGRHSATTQRNT